jgi:RHS repeat-associated protein
MSVRALTDLGGAVTDRYDYDAFGNLVARAGTTANVYLFNSQQLDSALGFYYLRARYYDPVTGRFASRDPWVGNDFDPASLHPYTYAHNNPVNMHDPTGQMTLLELGFVSVIVGTIAGIAWYNYSGNAAEAAFVGATAAAIVFTGGWAAGAVGGMIAFSATGTFGATAVASAPVVAAGAQRALPYTQRLEWYTLRNQEVLENMLRATYRFYARMPSFLRIVEIVDDWANNPRQGMIFVCGMRYFLLNANQDTVRRALGPYADAAFVDRLFFTLLRHAIGFKAGRQCPQ